MKILFLHRNLPPDSYTGVAIQVHRLANALIAQGQDVCIYTLSKKPIDAKYSVICLKDFKAAKVIKYFYWFKRILYPLWFKSLNFSGYDIVHIHGDGGFISYQKNFIRTFYGTAALEMKNEQTFKGKIAQGISYFFERNESQNCLWNIGIAPHIKEYLPRVQTTIPCMLPEIQERQLHFDQNDPIGINEMHLNLELESKTSFPSLIFLGSRFSRKRGDKAVDIFLSLKANHPNIKMTYIGPMHEIDFLKSQLDYSNIDFYSGISQEEMNSLFKKSWIYLSLSSYEGFGLGIIEAMAMGCLVISTPNSGTDFILQNQKNGVVCEIEETEKKIEFYLSNEKERIALQNAGLKYSKNYRQEVIAKKYIEVYEKIKTQSVKK